METREEIDAPGLDTLDCSNDIIRSKTVDVDGHDEQEEFGE